MASVCTRSSVVLCVHAPHEQNVIDILWRVPGSCYPVLPISPAGLLITTSSKKGETIFPLAGVQTYLVCG